MSPIHVVGIGLDGAAGLSEAVRLIVDRADILVGSDRHLSYFPDHPAQRIKLANLRDTLNQIKSHLALNSHLRGGNSFNQETLPLTHSDGQDAHPTDNSFHQVEETSRLWGSSSPIPTIAILTSGDPLFFGFGRLLLEEFWAEQITFHPHVSSVQLAFSCVKLPWQDAKVISAHGRSLEELTQALQQGCSKIAVLTDGTNTPGAIAQLMLSLDLPSSYQCWVCENLGGESEQVRSFTAKELVSQEFAPLNVVILVRSIPSEIDLTQLPAFGLPDSSFLSFDDRPGLMTKREIRILVLGELALQSDQIIWDIGAGTGSVSIEMGRLFPSSKIYAIEQTAAGIALIQQNSDRFQVTNVIPVNAKAPDGLANLPNPDRIFIGGSGGNLAEILNVCRDRLHEAGTIVLALATLEHLGIALNWVKENRWNSQLLQVQISRSTAIAALTRFSPLNPVTLVTLKRSV